MTCTDPVGPHSTAFGSCGAEDECLQRAEGNDQHRVGWATLAEPAGATVLPRSDSYFLRETSHLAKSIKRSIFN